MYNQNQNTEEQYIYILPPYSESMEVEIIAIKDDIIYYKELQTGELGQIKLFADGASVCPVENLPTAIWTASSLHADLHDANVEKEFSN